MSIQSFILSKCASASPSGLPASLGLKWDQFNCGLWGIPGAIEALGKMDSEGVIGLKGTFGGGF